MLVLAMLSQIAEDKQNVIFAMEEPETAIPPYAQKRIVHQLRKLSAQAIFTSHSPYVLEEFGLDETVVLSRAGNGKLVQASVSLPTASSTSDTGRSSVRDFVKVIVTSHSDCGGCYRSVVVPRRRPRLEELAPAKYSSLEALGICTIDAGTEAQIADLGDLYRSLGKTVYGLCDQQSVADEAAIKAKVDELFMHSEKGCENLVLKNTTKAALERFADLVTWPQHLVEKYPNPKDDVEAALNDYFRWSKGNWSIADFLSQCSEDEIPQWLRDCCVKLRELAQSIAEEVPPEEDDNADGVAEAMRRRKRFEMPVVMFHRPSMLVTVPTFGAIKSRSAVWPTSRD